MEKNLILDLRNNSGGGDKVSKPFQKFIEKEFKEGKIYILVNIKTASNAEITTQRMRFSKNVKVLGHSSSGILSYGSNYGNRVVLPSGNYYYKVTDMNFSEFLAYEGVGIPVDIELNLNEDWIDQTVKLFHKE
ncbi:MAG: S41 family peptidase [Flavobacteriaceae bacterium]